MAEANDQIEAVIIDNSEERVENDDEEKVAYEDSHKDEEEDKNAEEILNNKWGPDEVQNLLIKAISLRAPNLDIKTVLKCGAQVNKAIKNGLHPLHYAAYVDNVDCVTLLLNAGANVNATDDIGYTPLHLSARCGNYRSMEHLIENGAIINFNEPDAIIRNTEEKNKLGYSTTEPLNLAIQNSHPECARLLLQNGARAINRYFMGYEICLAPLDNVECLELLLDYGADLNVFNRCGLSPLMKACKDHHIDAVRLFLRRGVEINAQCPPLFEQKNALQFAILSGNIVIINLLLAKKAKISRNSNHKHSALHTAVIKGRADICRLLLQYNAEVDERTEEGATALMLACGTTGLTEREEIVNLLIDCGADVNAHGPRFCYFDPYLSPLTEYLKNVGFEEAFTIVITLVRNGARIHYCSGVPGFNRKTDPYAILPFAHCMKNYAEMFELTVCAASRFNPLAIYACDTLPEDMKDIALLQATRPRNLKQLVRLALHQYLRPGFPEKVKTLPLPSLLKSYLIFK